jgi:hypothetical protein
MRAEDLVELVEKRGLVGLQDELGCSRQRAESLDVEARRMIRLGFGGWDVGRSLAASVIGRQRDQGPAVREITPETARALAALERLERPPTGDEIASRLAEDRRREVERRNAQDEPARRAFAARVRAGGYRGFTGDER